ncbi:M4 family metallopeptidase [Solirubrobacter ginsenosidimutans]|uniref:Neutral metalloproteinase n=1 Tax=Solirubrobacter ginsenosidimutans TaxID=490573 RepID=A0A9X3S138_9ACTN|nr:M4 family metallopeptidase [Solirubrobacter ginsenosidimutans]MDA0159766.1 M4 family metallopeptidase [Solirubrobacter ginsenosidimutans]
MPCFIAPPDLLAYVIERGDPPEREAALRTIAASAALRAQRQLVGTLMRTLDVDAGQLNLVPTAATGQRTVYDSEHGGRTSLPGKLVRSEGDPPSSDAAVNEAYDGAGATSAFYRDAYGRNSIDGQGLELVSSVHYGVRYENAFWNGVQMVYGDGGGQLFNPGAFTHALDVIAHELTHGVTQYTAGLEYSLQPGALNESFSDVFGVLAKQYAARVEADEAEEKWLIGAGALVPKWGRALRSMKAPGTAWQGDQQPATMDGYVDLPDDNDPSNDNGGVHINSGIPNHAFYLAATAVGGFAWETVGRVWYVTLTDRLDSTAQFADAATATVEVARELFGDGIERAVTDAWTEVGVLS